MARRGALDARDRYFGRFSTPDAAFDANSFVQRATLFEEVIVGNPEHLAGLVDLFGADGFVEVLESGLIRFLSSVHMIGWADYLRHGFGQGRGLPLMSWFMEVVYVGSPPATERLEREATRVLSGRGVRAADQRRIISALRDRMATLTWDKNTVVAGLRADIHAYPRLVLEGVLDGVEGKLGRELDRDRVKLDVREPSAGIFAVDTNLTEVLGTSPAQVHELTGPALASYLGTHLQIEVLAQLCAVGEMRAVDAATMERRSNLLAELVADRRPDAFLKMLEIAEVPSLKEGVGIDATQFLRMREHPECRAFRDWLRQAGRFSDVELRDAISGWKARLAVMATGPKARILRWLASAGLGIAVAPAGVALSAADSFLVQKLLAPPGPAVFLERHYRPLVVGTKRAGRTAN